LQHQAQFGLNPARCTGPPSVGKISGWPRIAVSTSVYYASKVGLGADMRSQRVADGRGINSRRSCLQHRACVGSLVSACQPPSCCSSYSTEALGKLWRNCATAINGRRLRAELHRQHCNCCCCCCYWCRCECLEIWSVCAVLPLSRHLISSHRRLR